MRRVTTAVVLLLAFFASPGFAGTEPGKFGRAVRPGEKFPAAEINPVYSNLPVTVECWAKLDPAGKKQVNVLVANEQKSSGTHWHLYSQANTGALAAFLPSYEPAEIVSKTDVCDGQWHYLAMTHDGQTCRLFVDGKPVAEQALKKVFRYPDRGYLTFGYVGGADQPAAGLIDEVRISRGVRTIDKTPAAAFEPDDDTVGLWHFDEPADVAQFADASRTRNLTTLRGRDELIGDKPIERTRWMDMDLAPFISSTLAAPWPPGNVTYKGVSIQLGKDRKAAACFDTELMRWSAVWTGDFLKFGPVREGLAGPPEVAGQVQFGTAAGPGWARPGTKDFADPRSDKLGPLPKDWLRYKGLYVNGDRVVFSYTVGDCGVLDAAGFVEREGAGIFTRSISVGGSAHPQMLRLPNRTADGRKLGVTVVGPADQLGIRQDQDWNYVTVRPRQAAAVLELELRPGEDEALIEADPPPAGPAGLCVGGPANWPDPVVTKGTLGKGSGPYVVDTLTAPDENPWKSFIRFGGHDFFKNGDLAVCSVSGDVWVVSGIDEKLETLKWKRFATGMFQPLGLKVVDDKVYVLGRDQITRLHDLNADGEADFYENFNNDCKVTTNGHAYTTCLETDPAGNFYYTKCGDNTDHGGTVLRVSKDGSKLDVFATGVRNMNGAGAGPDGTITTADNQGEWVPASRLDVVEQGEFLGYQPMAKRNPPPTDPGKPLCWMPQNVDNSSGGQCWVTSDKWGPFQGQMLHTSYGAASLLLVLQEKVNGVDQGGVVRFPDLRFDTGVMRGRFSPADGQLYLSGLKGWQTAGVKDGALHRVRYTGKPVYMPKALHVHQNGLRITFTEPLDKELAVDLDSYGILQWNYKWTGDYGSRQWSVARPDQQGYDEVKVKAAHVSGDGRTVFLEVPDLRPVMQMQITYDLEATDGTVIRGDIYNTIHALAPAFDVKQLEDASARNNANRQDHQNRAPEETFVTASEAKSRGRGNWRTHSPLYAGERAGVRGSLATDTARQHTSFARWPLTLTLSPEYRGEGTGAGACRIQGAAAGPVVLAAVAAAAAPKEDAPPHPKKVVFLAGKKSHGPGEHEYEKGLRLLKHCLDTSPNTRNTQSVVVTDGWPADEAVFDDAATIVVFSDGADHNVAAHPLLVDDRLGKLDKLMDRGVGLVVLHYTLFVPSERGGKQFLEWVGGYFDYDTKQTDKDGKPVAGWYSKLGHATTTSVPTPQAKDHPIWRGGKPFTTRTEYYWNMRFRPDDKRLTPILTFDPDKGMETVVAWAVEREDGGRGFAFTEGHFHSNWKVEGFRRMVLNAILWTAKVDVPSTGVVSKLPEGE